MRVRQREQKPNWQVFIAMRLFVFFHKLRTVIAEKQQERAAQFAGEIELDESYSGGIRKCTALVIKRDSRGFEQSMIIDIALKPYGDVLKYYQSETQSIRQLEQPRQ
ncbi:MAG: hypothetical protein HRT36_02030 [Alphaproteobacteria bacterium]|nr:hypothetical protein [Alphaproteobacteria bacterium]